MGKLTNPLQALIGKAANCLPTCTGEVQRVRARLETPGAGTVILCDASASMAERASNRPKIEILHDALRECPAEAVYLAFAADVRQFQREERLEPNGCTAMHLGLRRATAFAPMQTIVISDGCPDSEQSALDAAEHLPGRIDVIYCGPDSDAQAMDFMRRLARGQVIVCDVMRMSRPELGSALKSCLALPAPREGG